MKQKNEEEIQALWKENEHMKRQLTKGKPPPKQLQPDMSQGNKQREKPLIQHIESTTTTRPQEMVEESRLNQSCYMTSTLEIT